MAHWFMFQSFLRLLSRTGCLLTTTWLSLVAADTARLKQQHQVIPTADDAARFNSAWWSRPWQDQWLTVQIAGQSYPVLTRRVGRGPVKLFCVQGGPGDMVWDLNFLAVYLDLDRFEIFQYAPPGSFPSACSQPEEACAKDRSWMGVDQFVDTMDQVHRALAIPDHAIIVAHSFGVVVALEFSLRWPMRAGGLVLSDWVACQEQAGRRIDWCKSNDWTLCRLYEPSLEEPWETHGPSNPFLGKFVWGPYGNGTGGALQNWDIRNQLHLLRGIPSLSLVGEFDFVFARDVQDMSRALHGEYVYLSDAGHVSFVDRRDRWLSAFSQWLIKYGLAETTIRPQSLTNHTALIPPQEPLSQPAELSLTVVSLAAAALILSALRCRFSWSMSKSDLKENMLTA